MRKQDETICVAICPEIKAGMLINKRRCFSKWIKPKLFHNCLFVVTIVIGRQTLASLRMFSMLIARQENFNNVILN